MYTGLLIQTPESAKLESAYVWLIQFLLSFFFGLQGLWFQNLAKVKVEVITYM